MSVSSNLANLSLKQKRGLLGELLEKTTDAPRIRMASFAQERLWFLDQFEPGSPVYNIPVGVGLPGRLNLNALKLTIDEIIRRHEVLRTTFSTVGGRPVQVIASRLSLELPIIDLRGFSNADRQRKISRLADEDAQRPFDLAHGPLLRGTLLRLADDDHLLLLTMHHIVSDGWSLGMFFNELTVLYQAYYSNKPSPLPDLPIQYADFAVWQRQLLQGESLEVLLRYWRRQLQDAPPVLDLPTDHARPAVQSFKGATCPISLGANLTQGLKDLSRQAGVTLFMSLLAAFKVLLYRYTGREDIVVGTPIANRNRAEIEGLIGFFVNTLVLRTDLSGNPRFRELLARVREVTLGAYEHQDLPFEKLVEELQPQRSRSYTPLFQVVFTLQNVPTLVHPRADSSPSAADAPQFAPQTGTAKFDLNLTLGETEQGLMGAFEYNTDLFEAETIKRMASHCQKLFEAIVTNPDQRLSDLPLFADGETEGYTASDFPEADLTQGDFEKLLLEIGRKDLSAIG